MKSSVQKFRPELEQLMEEAREAIAAERFEPVRVKGELSAAAKAGQSSYLMILNRPIDLRRTTAAQKLFDWCKKENLRVDWIKRPVENFDGDAAWDIFVSWKQK